MLLKLWIHQSQKRWYDQPATQFCAHNGKAKIIENCSKGLYKDTMAYKTVQSRLRILHLITAIKPILMSPTQRFALPPALNAQRKIKVGTLQPASPAG